MLPVNEHIFTLLYDHDCVIIPEFGGFVANLHSAILNSQTHVIDPPGKRIAFNKHLVSNDGLLAHAVAKAEGLSYDDALEAIRKEVLGLKADIESGKRVNFHHLGVLYRNQDGALQFVPSNDRNFLYRSFGLSRVHLVPKTAPEMPEPIKELEEAVPVVPIVDSEGSESKENTGWRRWAAAAVLIPAVLVGGWLVKDQFTNGQTLSLGDFNPMRKNVEISAGYQPRFAEEDIHFDHPEEINILDKVSTEYPDMNLFYYSFTEEKFTPDGVRIDMGLDRTEAVPAPKSEATSSSLDLYFIVAGAFQDVNNANGLVEKLQQKGYDATIFAKKGKLHMVSYGSYPNKRTAKKALNRIRHKENKKAWLKRK